MQNEEEKALFDKYCGNNMKEIRKICYPLIQKSNIPMSEHDDIYSDAQKVVMESVKSYDKNKKCSFNTYFIGNMKRSLKIGHVIKIDGNDVILKLKTAN